MVLLHAYTKINTESRPGQIWGKTKMVMAGNLLSFDINFASGSLSTHGIFGELKATP